MYSRMVYMLAARCSFLIEVSWVFRVMRRNLSLLPSVIYSLQATLLFLLGIWQILEGPRIFCVFLQCEFHVSTFFRDLRTILLDSTKRNLDRLAISASSSKMPYGWQTCTGWKEKFVRHYRRWILHLCDLMGIHVKNLQNWSWPWISRSKILFFLHCILLITKVKLYQGTMDRNLIVLLKNDKKVNITCVLTATLLFWIKFH